MDNICPRMATINETSEITGLNKYFVRQLAITNKIKTIKAGKKYLINVDKLIEYLNKGDSDFISEHQTVAVRKIS